MGINSKEISNIEFPISNKKVNSFPLFRSNSSSDTSTGFARIKNHITYGIVSYKDVHAVLEVRNIPGQRIAVLLDADVKTGVL